MATTEQTILAVVAGVETSSQVLAAAIERVEQEAVSLVVLHVMTHHVYDRRRDSYAAIRELKHDGFTFTHDQATESAERIAERAAQAAIGERDIPYTPVGRVGDLVSTVLAVAATHGCDTILLQKTYPLWRRVIGLADRRLAKRFDGTIVRVPRSPPENLKATRSLPVE